MRFLIIHNPNSGLGSDDVFSFSRALVQNGDELVMRTVSRAIPDETLVTDADTFDTVIISGGDGTAATISYAMRNTKTPILMFPSGTANLLANNIGNSFDPAGLAKAVRTGTTADIDMGEMSFTYNDGTPGVVGFNLMGGAGFDAKLMQDAVDLKGALGQLSYYVAALNNTRPTLAKFTVEADGKIFEEEGIGVLIANWGSVTNGLPLVPEYPPTDGMLDVLIIKTANTVELLPTVLNVIMDRAGDHPKRPNVSMFKAKYVKVTSDPVLPMQFDGDIIENATTPFTARSLPGANHIIVDPNSPLSPYTVNPLPEKTLTSRVPTAADFIQ